MNTEPKLISGPKRRTKNTRSSSRQGTPTSSTAPRASTPRRKNSASTGAATRRHQDPDRNLTEADAVEGTEAFQNRISEITSFKVVSRVRPFIPEELAEMVGQERRSIVEMAGTTTILLDPKDNWAPKAQFEFDASLWSIPPSHKLVHTFQDTRRQDYATQKDVYNIIAKDLVPHVFDGFNGCILTYGQTGSGKTYTMMGMYDPQASCGGDGEEGIIPRVSNDLFLLLDERVESEKQLEPRDRARYRVEVSFVEIYMERVRDLLDPALRNSRGNEKLQDARIRQDPYTGPFVEGVTKYQVENWAQCCTLLERGSQHRTTCATAVHNQSSRSHAIFQLTVLQERVVPAKDRYSRATTKTQGGRINLVDLAGSERGGFQDYVKESAAINTSLLALRRVIDNLTERQNMLMEQVKAEITGGYYQERPLPQVPFRDSVLTWLLSDSIGGNARTTMVATLSPLVKNYGDTLATLQWSSKARNLVTLVKMNDQSMVQDGLARNAGELGNAVQIQRSNLDSLRETLRYKQETAERLEKETKALQKSLDKSAAKRNGLVRDRAALIIQRAFHRFMCMRKLQQYQQHQEKLRNQGSGNDKDREKFEQLRKEAEKKEEDAKARFRQAEAETDALAAKMADIEANRDAFENRKREANERHDRIYEQIRAQELCQRHADKLDQEVKAAKASSDEAKKAKEERERQIAEMQAKIDASKTPEWAEKVKKDEEDLAELRRRRDDLKARRDQAFRDRDMVRAKHAKVFSK